MPLDHSAETTILIGTGLGLLTVAATLLAPARRGWVGAALGVAGAGVVGATLLGPVAGWAAAGLTLGPTAAAWAFGSTWPTAVLARLRPVAVRAGGTVAVGLALVTTAIAWDDLRYGTAADGDTAWLQKVGDQPDVAPAFGIEARTDLGRRLDLKTAVRPRPAAALRAKEAELLAGLPFVPGSFPRQPAGDACNCHGWVFTGGRFWLGPKDVQRILAENGYAPVTEPRAGDLAVYRREEAIVHTAVVRIVGPGLPVFVEGKWGWLGVYLHPADQSSYGPDITYYRSPRPGHRLTGLGPEASPGPPRQRAVTSRNPKEMTVWLAR